MKQLLRSIVKQKAFELPTADYNAVDRKKMERFKKDLKNNEANRFNGGQTDPYSSLLHDRYLVAWEKEGL